MESDSDTLSAGDSDDGYMDGIKIHENESEDEERDTFNTDKTSMKSAEEKETDRLTHVQKIKAQRKLSSTPLHDYKNPSRILDPQFFRGVVPLDQTQDASFTLTPDLNHNDKNAHTIDTTGSYSDTGSNSPTKSPSNVRFSIVEEEYSDVFISLNNKTKEHEDLEKDRTNNVGKDNVEKDNNKLQSPVFPTGSNIEKQRKNACALNPYVNRMNSQEYSNILHLDVQRDNAVGETVVSTGREEAKQSLIKLTNQSPTSISPDSTCRSWSNSSEDNNQSIFIESNGNTNVPQFTIQESRVAHQTTVSNTHRNNSSDDDNRKSGKDFLTATKRLNDQSSASSSDIDTYERNDVDYREGYNVIKLRPRTFTDTSTDDDEVRQNVKDRVKRMRKPIGESDA